MKIKRKYNDTQPFRTWKIRIEELILKLQEKNKINDILIFVDTSYRSIFDTIYKDLNLIVRGGEKNKYVYSLI